MMYVFLAGFVGFLVFDAYRVRRVWEASGSKIYTFRSPLEIIVHIWLYVSAGIVAVVINLDVLLTVYNFAAFPDFDQSILGSIARGFGIGVAGPAGLSKGHVTTLSAPPAGHDFGDLPAGASLARRARAALSFILMR